MRWFGGRRARRDALVITSGGVGNLGDDAILVQTVARLHGLDPQLAIDVLADERAPLPATAARPIGVLTEHADLDLRGYRLVLIAGGGYATDWFGAHVAPRTALAQRAAREGIPVVVTGQGVGPLTDDNVIRELDALARVASAFSVRDECSRDLLHARGHDAVVTGDDALGLPAGPAPARGGVALHLRHAAYHSDDRDALAAWAAATRAVATAADLPIVGVAINDRAEAPETETLDAAGVEPVVDLARDPRALVATVARARLVVAHSCHVALFALAAGTPAVLAAASPYYEQKAEGLRRLAAVSDAFVVAGGPPSGSELADRLATVARDLEHNDALAAATARVDTFLTAQCAARLP
jgi:polysaccharide pyruvyl transferase WcaK-like protein